MITKTIDKSSKPERSAASSQVSSKSAKSNRGLATSTTKTRKREDASDQQSSQAPTTKHAQLLQLLSRPEGASIEELTRATNWQQHSVRGFLAGTVKKKMGLAVTSSKADDELRRYRIPARRGR